jgi:hypothetical protein
VFSQLNFVLMLAELLSELAVSCGAPLAALMDASDGEPPLSQTCTQSFGYKHVH